jgi:uncharacterized protein (UPF0548 family)
MLRFGRPSDADLEVALAEQSDAPLTYTEVGTTEGDLPAGFRHDHYRRSLGTGDAVWEAARTGLREWACHDGAGLTRLLARPELRQGTTLVQVLPLGPAHVLAACRIVYVIDEPDRFGFAYGTLPLHPEAGEEAFVVSRDASGEVTLDIVVFSRPRHPLARLGWFVGRQIQVQTTNRFLDGLERYVERSLAAR